MVDRIPGLERQIVALDADVSALREDVVKLREAHATTHAKLHAMDQRRAEAVGEYERRFSELRDMLIGISSTISTIDAWRHSLRGAARSWSFIGIAAGSALGGVVTAVAIHLIH